MATDTKITKAVASLMADAGIGTLADVGFVDIYDGSVPADANASLDGSNHLLVHKVLPADAFPAAVDGLLTANAIVAGTVGTTGTAAFFRVTKADGTVLYQGLCGTSGADMNFDSVALSSGAAFSLPSLTYTVDRG